MTFLRAAIVVGTRPELIKTAVIRRLLGDAAVLVHTGQHYSRNMTFGFLEPLGARGPDVQLDHGGLPRAEQIARMTEAVAIELRRFRPRCVVVQGDTNSALAGALAANAEGVRLMHVEAGLRSFDRAMPEEHNRVIVDHIADDLFAPTLTTVKNLEREGVTGSHVQMVGNTIVEAVAEITTINCRSPNAAYGVLTLHRPENVDSPERLQRILDATSTLHDRLVFPAHPRTQTEIAARGIRVPVNIQLVDPLDYVGFVNLMQDSDLVVSDSGGIQEEATVLGVPVLVIRRSTERPEALGSFCALVADVDMLDEELRSRGGHKSWKASLAGLQSPFGDGGASRRIAGAILSLEG